MTTMLEKMALEIHRKIIGLPKDPDLSDCLDAARRALEAIREPEPVLLREGVDPFSPEWTPGSQMPIYRTHTHSIFTAIIDEILAATPAA